MNCADVAINIIPHRSFTALEEKILAVIEDEMKALSEGENILSVMSAITKRSTSIMKNGG